jgi:hypothetical protein
VSFSSERQARLVSSRRPSSFYIYLIVRRPLALVILFFIF